LNKVSRYFDVLDSKIVAEWHYHQQHLYGHNHVPKLLLVAVYLAWRGVESRRLFSNLHGLYEVENELLKVDYKHQENHEVTIREGVVRARNLGLDAFDGEHNKY